MGRIATRAVLTLAVVVASTGFAPFSFARTATESTSNPAVKRTKPIVPQATITSVSTNTSSVLAPSAPTSSNKVAAPAASAAPAAAAAQSASLGPNLIQNPSVETVGTNGLPDRWNKGGYGTNTRVLTYPVTGYQTLKGLQVVISAYTDGDAKWFFDDVSVSPGKQYQFSDYYNSNVGSTLFARFLLSSGLFAYQDLATLPSSTVYTNATTTFTAPGNAVSVTVFHVISQAGTLQTDEFELREVTTGNLIANSDLELSGTNGQPLNWFYGGWGTNTRQFSYPVQGVNNSRAIRVAINTYQNGDAKWVFDPVTASRGIYTFSTQYQANIPSLLTIQHQYQDNSYHYVDIATVPVASSSFMSASTDLWVPSQAKATTVFHLIQGIGNLTSDNTALTFKAAPSGIFTTGAVSITFDDGYLTQYQNAAPKLNAAGFKATFYIITQQLADNGFSGFMQRSQVTQLFNQGHEIGAHTRTHPHLPTLSQAQQLSEIQGSRTDLLNMSVGPILSFAAPYGDYNATTLQTIKDAGFAGARATLPGVANPALDHYQLPIFSVESTTTLNDVKLAIDNAVAAKEWLILVFHRIDTIPDQYTTSPQTFNQIIDYLSAQGVPVVTISQGMQSMQ